MIASFPLARKPARQCVFVGADGVRCECVFEPALEQPTNVKRCPEHLRRGQEDRDRKKGKR